jgi:hypothetical protein
LPPGVVGAAVLGVTVLGAIAAFGVTGAGAGATAWFGVTLAGATVGELRLPPRAPAPP